MSLYLRVELGPFFLELGRLAEAEPEEAEDEIRFVLDSQTPATVEAPRPGFRIVGDGCDVSTDV